MSNVENNPNNDSEIEHFPIEPRFHPANRLARSIYDALASAKLAMALLVTILLCCVAGVTIYREQQSTEMVFGTLWFNSLLILLVTNTACCFFGRIWGRRVTVISFGMILFHLSFVVTFLAIVYNSLFYFDGSIRLTEGESLSNGDSKSYDYARHGLFFDYSRMKGVTTLQHVQRGYRVAGEDKQIAYDITLSEGTETKNATIYTNNKYASNGVEYFRDKEGYSLLTVANDRQGKELYGAHIPLQSFRQKDGSYIYASGSAAGPGLLDFPPEQGKAFMGLQLTYTPDSAKDRSGRVRFQVWPTAKGAGGHPSGLEAKGAAGTAGMHTMNPEATGASASADLHKMNLPDNSGSVNPDGRQGMKQLADGTAGINEKFAFGEYELFVPEVRYWVAMSVRYNPGKPFVLASLCMGLTGMIITTAARMLRKRK